MKLWTTFRTTIMAISITGRFWYPLKDQEQILEWLHFRFQTSYSMLFLLHWVHYQNTSCNDDSFVVNGGTVTSLWQPSVLSLRTKLASWQLYALPDSEPRAHEIFATQKLRVAPLSHKIGLTAIYPFSSSAWTRSLPLEQPQSSWRYNETKEPMSSLLASRFVLKPHT